MKNASSAADPELVKAWVAGWALARNLAAPVPFEGGLRVDTGAPEERVRYVLFGADAMLIRALIAEDTGPNAFLKICAAPEEVAKYLPPDWLLHERQYLMTFPLRQSPPKMPLGAGYSAKMHDHRPVWRAMIEDRSGHEIASGRLVIVGPYGIIDHIYTDPAHRRRGLATRIVGDLMRLGRFAGAKTGVLVANSNGYRLYLKMGWEVHAPYTSAYRG